MRPLSDVLLHSRMWHLVYIALFRPGPCSSTTDPPGCLHISRLPMPTTIGTLSCWALDFASRHKRNLFDMVHQGLSQRLIAISQGSLPRDSADICHGRPAAAPENPTLCSNPELLGILQGQEACNHGFTSIQPAYRHLVGAIGYPN